MGDQFAHDLGKADFFLVGEVAGSDDDAQRYQFLPDYNRGNPLPDKYLGEAMFGPDHPRASGAAGLQAGAADSTPRCPASARSAPRAITSSTPRHRRTCLSPR